MIYRRNIFIPLIFVLSQFVETSDAFFLGLFCKLPLLRLLLKKFCDRSFYDVNDDGSENLSDLIDLLRTIDDPFKKYPPQGNLDGDLNNDTLVDTNDAVLMIEQLTLVLGAKALGNLTPAFFDNVLELNIDQQNLTEGNGTNARNRVLMPANRNVVPSFMLPPTANISFPDRNLQKQCGTSSSLNYARGTGSDPIIGWDLSNCKFDAKLYESLSVVQKTTAHASWNKYYSFYLLAVLPFPEAAKAYANYRSNSGANILVDYQKAINDDALIKQKFDEEIASVLSAVQLMFGGSDFSFYSTKTRLVPGTTTTNWRRALGGHRIWSVGTVTYNQVLCQLQVDITTKMEDYYNFNPGQYDVTTGLPDNENCLFAQLGWAKPFYSRGSVQTVRTIDLPCCQDSDCGSVTSFDCECNECVTQCPTQQRSGGQGFFTFSVDLKKTQGVFQVSYQMYQIPDALIIYYNGNPVFSTGGLVSGGLTVMVPYGSSNSTSTLVRIEISAPTSGTLWDVAVGCPP
jgi:hypothetical protein